jgi:post-segregation antitoxin (ccd killing protein)
MAGEKVACRQCGAKIRLPAGLAATTTQSQVNDPAEQSAPPSTFLCAVCRQQFDVGDVYDQDGTIICKGCFAAQHADAATEVQESIVCASCGGAVAPDQVEEWDGRFMCASCALLAAARPVAMPVRKPIAKKSNSNQIWIIGAGVAAVVAIAIVLIVRGRNGNSVARTISTVPEAPGQTPLKAFSAATAPAPWAVPAQDGTVAHLTLLRAQAVDQETAGDLKGAAATYEQIIDVGEHADNPSEAAKAQVAAAKTALLAVKERLAAVATPAPATTAPAPTALAAGQPPPETPTANQSWEQQHSARIRELLHQGETRLAGNDLFKAALTYQQLFGLVGPHLAEIHDPQLKQQIIAAAAVRGKLLVQVKSSPESVSMTADTLLASGLEALQEKRWQAGLESLSDVRALFDRNVKLPVRATDSKYLMALDGMAVAYLKLKQAPKAGELFDDGAPLGEAVDRSPTREMVINRAALDIIQRTKAMRAAKSLTAWLQKHPGNQPDEDLLNILGTALFIADQHTTGKSKLEEFAQVYSRENERLEHTRPGEKRWGIEWLAEAEADRKIAERNKALSEFARYSRQAASAYSDWQTLQGYYNTFTVNGVRKASLAQVQQAERNFNGWSNKADEARKNIPDMSWLTEIEPVLPPLPQGVTAVAVATPAETDGQTPTSVFTIPNITLHDRPTPSETQSPPESAPPKPPVHISVPRYALAFPIDKTRLISSADVVASMDKVRLMDSQGQPYGAHVVARQDHLVLLELDAGQGGFGGYLNLAENFSGGAVSCACVPQESIFGPQPTMLSGQAVAPHEGAWAVSLADHPRLAGSPLLDAQGNVVGVVIAKRDDLKTRLPAVPLADLRQFLTAQSALPSAPSARPDSMNVLEVTVQEN